jgi:hypothetical protein
MITDRLNRDWIRTALLFIATGGLCALSMGQGCVIPVTPSEPQILSVATATVDSGNITVTGSGFTPNQEVDIAFLNLPDQSTGVNAAVTANSAGAISFSYRFIYDPQCDFANTKVAVALATDTATDLNASDTFVVFDCVLIPD